jgi:TrmH family RNA methyltransferase
LKEITSRANPSVKLAIKLRTRRGRDDNNAFLVEGGILIEEAAGSGADIAEIFVREGSDADASGYEVNGGVCGGHAVRVSSLSGDLFDEITDTVTPHDIIAIVRKPGYKTLESELSGVTGRGETGTGQGDTKRTLSVIVLDRLQDPGNVGTVLRSADAAGFDAVIAVKGTADVYAPKVVRAAAGAIFRIPVLQAQDADEVIAALRAASVKLCALHMEGADFGEAELSGRTALVVGSEGAGVSKDFLLGAQMRVSIPMREGADSLNAGVAASIVMFEKIRQEKLRSK